LTIDGSIPKTLSGVERVLADKNPDLLAHMSIITSTTCQGVQE